eukprot:COSAG01_NODE_15626_length_1318_cov_1.360952_1_plen_198_part_00
MASSISHLQVDLLHRGVHPRQVRAQQQRGLVLALQRPPLRLDELAPHPPPVVVCGRFSAVSQPFHMRLKDGHIRGGGHALTAAAPPPRPPPAAAPRQPGAAPRARPWPPPPPAAARRTSSAMRGAPRPRAPRRHAARSPPAPQRRRPAPPHIVFITGYAIAANVGLSQSTVSMVSRIKPTWARKRSPISRSASAASS